MDGVIKINFKDIEHVNTMLQYFETQMYSSHQPCVTSVLPSCGGKTCKAINEYIDSIDRLGKNIYGLFITMNYYLRMAGYKLDKCDRENAKQIADIYSKAMDLKKEYKLNPEENNK